MAEFAINDARQESTCETPFMLNHGQHPLGKKNEPYELANSLSCACCSNLHSGVQQTLERAKDCLTRAQQRQKAYADQGLLDASYQVGDILMLNTRNIRSRSPGAPKLVPRWFGPFLVECIGTLAYRIQLHASMQSHPVFCVSLLQSYREDGRVQPPPPPFYVGKQLA